MHLKVCNLFSLKNLWQLKGVHVFFYQLHWNMWWASLSFSLHGFYGTAPLFCLYEQFLPATFSSTTGTVRRRWESIWKLWVWENYNLKPLSSATKNFKQNGNSSTLSTSWLIMTLVSPIFFLVGRIMTSSFRTSTLLLLLRKLHVCEMREKGPSQSNPIWRIYTRHSSTFFCQSNTFPARQKKDSTRLCVRLGAKYFNNSSQTVKKRARDAAKLSARHRESSSEQWQVGVTWGSVRKH